jgi:hypothetical protein
MTPSKHLPKPSRRGVGLVELLVMLAGGSVLLGTVGVLIGVMFRSEQLSARKVSSALSADRLARQFRQDAHSALRADLLRDQETPGLQFSLEGDRRISYVAGNDRLVRTATAAGEREHRDEYRIAHSEWKFELTHDDRLAELDCVRTDRAATGDVPIPVLHVEAAVKARKSSPAAASEVTP